MPMVPNVSIPSAWQSYSQQTDASSSFRWGASAQSQSQLPPWIQSPAYEKYKQERDKMMQKTYKDKELERVNIAMQVCREIPGKTKPALVSNIFEGKNDISAQITTKELQDLIFNQMRPRLEEATHFQFDWNCKLTNHAIVIRELDTWVDLGSVNPTRPYLYDRCLVEPRGKNNDGRKVFKKPGKPFTFALVISCEEWDRYTSHLEQEEFGALEQSRRSAFESDASDRDVEVINYYSGNRHTNAHPTVKKTVAYEPANTSNNTKIGYRTESCSSLFGTPKRQRSPETEELQEDQRKSKKTITTLSYQSPDREKIKNALLKGGASTTLNAKAFAGTLENIEFTSVIERPFFDLLNGPTHLQAFQYESTNTRPGTLYTRHEEQLGAGTFKTAHPGQLSLSPPLDSGLGCSPNENVVVKRMFFKVEIKGKKKQMEGDVEIEAHYKIQRYVFSDELNRVLIEANMLYWSSSLMSLSYSFIDSYLAKSEPPTFEIPQFRFVNAGVAISHDRKGPNKIAGEATKGAESKRAYLLEEYIDEDQGFIKYISNGSAIPCIDANHPLYLLAEFLSFIQHVQYSKTGGTVYVSDFQGGKQLLTDPQIMTSPYETLACL
ncbi:hypothetical protein H0H92_004416 [Tricholoma furcatifolium]|nr:hypothetical protein H0H92_004416 [Tricholoma furcatifolium]